MTTLAKLGLGVATAAALFGAGWWVHGRLTAAAARATQAKLTLALATDRAHQQAARDTLLATNITHQRAIDSLLDRSAAQGRALHAQRAISAEQEAALTTLHTAAESVVVYRTLVRSLRAELALAAAQTGSLRAAFDRQIMVSAGWYTGMLGAIAAQHREDGIRESLQVPDSTAAAVGLSRSTFLRGVGELAETGAAIAVTVVACRERALSVGCASGLALTATRRPVRAAIGRAFSGH